MQDIIRWLESPEGEQWSRQYHAVPNCGNQLISIRDQEDGSTYGYIWYATYGLQ